MEEQEELKEAIARLEAQRETLGDAAVDAAIVGLYQRLAKLTGSHREDPAEVPPVAQFGERRVVTILFCDVTGSTAMAERLDPEEWMDIMNVAFDRLIEPVERFGGTVTRLMGDAVLAVFGAPTAHEDDPERAVHAGLAMLDAIGPFREELQQHRGLDFNIRVGINTGLAVVGEVGSDAYGEYSAMGDAVNLAARMQQTAAPGTVQIAQDTYSLIEPSFEIASLGAISVKGKAERVPAYRVISKRAGAGRSRSLTEHGISSPLIGREQEFKTAVDAFVRLQEGKGTILAVFGEAGIGKSRLLAEVRQAILGSGRQSPVRWLEGNTLSYGQTISYWPFQEILRGYAGINEEDDETEAWRKLEQPISDLFPETAGEVLPYLASLLAIEVRGAYAERVRYLDGEVLGRQVYRASRLFFQRLAEQRPLVLVFEDLHWMDGSSAGLLEHLLPLVRRAPLLIFALSRPDPDTPAGHLREVAGANHTQQYTELLLKPLAEKDSGRLVHNLLEIDDLPAHVRKMMVAKADGNPFFLEEIVHVLIENGALVRDDSTGRWLATPAAETVAVPDTIQGLINARIDRLDAELKRVVRRAAVIGRTFLYRVLEAVLEQQRDLGQQLERLQRTELIREKQRLPELEYIFKHALAQEAAYEGILLQERRAIHAQVAAAIQSLMADRLEEFYGLLAYHYSAAEQWEPAQEYLFKAGDQAGSMAADAEALAHYRQAMEAYAKVRGDDWDPVERARLERKIGEALYRQGQHSQARVFLERSLAFLGVGLPASRRGTRLAILRALLTQAGHRLLPRLFVRPMSSSPEPLVEEIYYASLALGWVELMADPERYLLLAVRALNACERGGFAFGSADMAATMGIAASLVSQFGIARRYLQQSTLNAEQIRPYRPVYQLELAVATHFNMLGDTTRMREHGQRGADMAFSAGDLRAWGLGMANVAFSHAAVGNIREGVHTCREMLRVAEESSDRGIECTALFAYGIFQTRMGQIDEAISGQHKAIEIAEDLPDYITLSGAKIVLGIAYLAQGKTDRAIEVLEIAEQQDSERGSNLAGYAFIGLALADAYLTRAEEVEGETRKVWLKKAGPVCQKTYRAATRNRQSLPAAMMYRGRHEWLCGRFDTAQDWWARALAQAEETGLIYYEALIHLEIGRRLGDRDHLQSAESIMESLGAELDLAKVRKALIELPESSSISA